MLPNEQLAIDRLATQFRDDFARMDAQLELALLLLKGNIEVPGLPTWIRSSL